MSFVEYLKSLIKSIKLKEVLQKLSSLFTIANPDLETDAIMLFADYNRLRTERQEGIISEENYNLRLAQLIKRLINLVNEVDENLELYSNYIDKKSNKVIKRNSSKKTILFLGANPNNASIDLKREIEEISNKLALIDKRKEFEFKIKMDVRKKDFQRSILELDEEPKFLHFSGSAVYKDKKRKNGLELIGNDFKSTTILEPEMLTRILSKFNSLECVFLNACHTTPLAIDLSKHIPYIISMDNFVSDKFAIALATSFYEALGAGKDIEFSFNYSLDNLILEETFTTTELKTPRLIKKGEKINYKWPGQTYEKWKEIVHN